MSGNIHTYQSPVGTLYLASEHDRLCGVFYESMWPLFAERFAAFNKKNAALLKETQKQLKEYFAGQRQTFSLPIELYGTPFQKRAWAALQSIPFGTTVSYKEQANLIHAPKAARAVGHANGRNPICIILPCHRVVGSNRALTGYAGGLKAKEFLLDHEAQHS